MADSGYMIDVLHVFQLTGRGTAVIGRLTGGDAQSGDRVEIRDGATVTGGAEIVVEVHKPAAEDEFSFLVQDATGPVTVGVTLAGPLPTTA